MARLYISGPVTGRPDDNHEVFEDARKRLNAAGFTSFDPHKLVPHDDPHDEAMRGCIHELTAPLWGDGETTGYYDGLALLPGWEQSEGAKLEKAVAEACGIPCKTVDEWLEVTDER